MATDLQQRIDSLKAKTHVLVRKYAALEQVRRQLEQELKLRDEAIAQRDRTIAEQQRSLEFLRASVTINPDREEVERTRSLIAGLVREIDRCILDLTD